MKKATITALLAMGLGLAGCAGTPELAASGCAEDAVACQAGVLADNEMTEISFQDAIDRFKAGEDGIYYFGFQDCPWCQEAVPVLQEEAEKAGKSLYYIRTRDEEHNRLYTDAQRQAIKPYLEDYMQEDDEGVLSLYVPLVIRMQDGKVTAGHQGTVEGHDAKERTMTAAESEQLHEIYRQLLAD